MSGLKEFLHIPVRMFCSTKVLRIKCQRHCHGYPAVVLEFHFH
jgi:hypothetical protein